MAARKGWDELSEPYRRRLERAGVTEATYQTADLRKARGHGFRAPATAAPEAATQRIAQGVSGAADRRALDRWRKGRSFPSWLPRDRADLDDASVAILSTISPAPTARGNGWESVVFDWGKDPNAPVFLTVTPKRGYQFQVALPNHDAARSFLSWMRRSGKFPGVSVDHKSHGQMKNENNAAPSKPAAPAGAAPAKKAAKKPAKKAVAKKAAKKTKKAAKKAAPLNPLAALEIPADLIDDALELLGGPDTTDPVELLRRALERLQELT